MANISFRTINADEGEEVEINGEKYVALNPEQYPGQNQEMARAVAAAIAAQQADAPAGSAKPNVSLHRLRPGNDVLVMGPDGTETQYKSFQEHQRSAPAGAPGGPQMMVLGPGATNDFFNSMAASGWRLHSTEVTYMPPRSSSQPKKENEK